MWRACAFVNVGLAFSECTSHPSSFVGQLRNISCCCPISCQAKAPKDDVLQKRIFLLWWNRFWATYQLVTLGKSFPFLGPRVLISEFREVGQNLAMRLSLKESVTVHSWANGQVEYDLMGMA